MGWEGIVIFEEEINGRWVEFAQIDRRVIMPFKEIVFPSFARVKEHDVMCEVIGTFYLRDLARAPDTKIMDSTILSYEEIMDKLDPELAEKIKSKMIKNELPEK